MPDTSVQGNVKKDGRVVHWLGRNWALLFLLLNLLIDLLYAWLDPRIRYR